MKQSNTELPPISVPRLDSLLHRLQHAPGADDESYLDQLMIFLDDPPAGTRDRWKEGAKMCGDWGIACSGASVWRLYRSHVLEWRLRLAQEAAASAGETPQFLQEKTAQFVSLRTFEVLANPQSPPACLVNLARIELRKQALEFARQKHQDGQKDKIQLALEDLAKQVRCNREAAFAFRELKASLGRKNPPTPFFDCPGPEMPTGFRPPEVSP
jgi:hypothetical protein